MSRRGSSLFAALAGIGAYFVAYGVASGIGFDLWTSGRLVFPVGPPRLEPTLAVGALAGAFVGFRLGGWRGALGPVLFALASVIGGLRFFIPLFECAFGDAVQCRGLLDLDFVIPQLWLVPGFVLGVLLALRFRPRVPCRTELEAAGVFAFSVPISYLLFVIPAYLPFFQGSDRSFLYVDQLTLLNVGVTLVAAVLAAALLIRRAKRPRQAGLVLTLVIAMLALPQLTYQIRFPASGVDLIERLRFLPSAGIILAITLAWGPRRGVPVAGQRAVETSST
jgi:hypothetical protein